MDVGEVLANDVGRVCAACELLASASRPALAPQLIPKLPFPSRAFGSGVNFFALALWFRDLGVGHREPG